MNSVAADMQTYLRSINAVDGSTGWPSVLRRVFDAPGAHLVIITEDGGASPELPGTPGKIGDHSILDPAVQVRVRAGEWDSPAAQSKAAELFDTLNGKLAVTMGTTRYLRVRAQTPQPVFIGFDEKGRPEYTISFLCARHYDAVA